MAPVDYGIHVQLLKWCWNRDTECLTQELYLGRIHLTSWAIMGPKYLPYSLTEYTECTWNVFICIIRCCMWFIINPLIYFLFLHAFLGPIRFWHEENCLINIWFMLFKCITISFNTWKANQLVTEMTEYVKAAMSQPTCFLSWVSLIRKMCLFSFLRCLFVSEAHVWVLAAFSQRDKHLKWQSSSWKEM